MPYKDHETCLRKAAEYRVKNRDAIRERRKGQNDRIRAAARARYHANPEKYRDAGIKWRYGISAAECDAMLIAQGGVCAVCGTCDWAGPGKRPHIDHDHITEKVRGLVCVRCNVLLGMARDCPGRLLNAVAYLKKHAI